jgi:hypothetical protein
MNDDIFKLAKESPLDALKECHSRIQKGEHGYQKQLHLRVAEVCAIAYALTRDPSAWHTFAKDPYWESRKKPPKSTNPKRPLLNVMDYAFRGMGDNGYRRAQKYAAALNKYFIEGVNPEEIEQLIEQKGGLEAMAREAAGEKKEGKRTKAVKNATSHVHLSDPDDLVGDDNDQQNQSDNDQEDEGQDDGYDTEWSTDNEWPSGGSDVAVSGKRSKKAKALKDGAKKRSPHIYNFISSKKCAPRIQGLEEGQRARLTIKMVERQGELFPKVMSVKALEP